MKLLVLGAGGVGGYYGGRILAAGGDVTFLVRPARAAQLRAQGLRVVSPYGDLQLSPRVLTAEELRASGESFDVIILTCKAYDLDAAIDSVAPAVGPDSLVMPLLNGLRHLDALVGRFGRQRVIGGVVLISVALGQEGEVRHLNKVHRFVTGALDSEPPAGFEALTQLLAGAGFEFIRSGNIEQAMWDKVVFLATLAGATCMMRASVGQIMDTLAGEFFINGLLDECAAIAEAGGHRLADAVLANHRDALTDKKSALVASMLRDIERNATTEADHILGDLTARAHAAGISVPCLRLAYSHLQAYDNRRRG